MNIITYIKPIPIVKKIFSVALSLIGIAFFLTHTMLYGMIFIVIGINLLVADGSQINLTNKTYRTVKSIFGWNFGTWKSCPNFEYISVFKTKENQRVNGMGATASFNSELIYINLFYQRNKHFTFYKTNNKSDAFEVAEHFKMALDIDILDATEKDSKWL